MAFAYRLRTHLICPCKTSKDLKPVKVVAENYNTGSIGLVEVPSPGGRSGCILVSVNASLISSGTERALIEVASKSLLGKALARPQHGAFD